MTSWTCHSCLWQILRDEGLFQSQHVDGYRHVPTRVDALKTNQSIRLEGTSLKGSLHLLRKHPKPLLCQLRPHVVLSRPQHRMRELLTTAASVYPASFSRAGIGLWYSSSEQQDLVGLSRVLVTSFRGSVEPLLTWSKSSTVATQVGSTCHER